MRGGAPRRREVGSNALPVVLGVTIRVRLAVTASGVGPRIEVETGQEGAEAGAREADALLRPWGRIYAAFWMGPLSSVGTCLWLRCY